MTFEESVFYNVCVMKTQVYNPYLPMGTYIPDGEPRVFGGRVYVYGSHDKCGSVRYCPGDYTFWSAPTADLKKWTLKGCSYPRYGIGNRLGFRCMWAPDCVRGTDGKYYLYYSFDFHNRINVACCDTPDGKFEYCGYVKHKDGKPYGKGKSDIMCFDPAAFVDDDKRVYLYSGYSANDDLKRMLNRRGIRNVDGTGGQVAELESDMMTVKSTPKMLIPGYKNSAGTGFEGHEMYEASSMRKIGGKYYFIYSTRLSHELAYAVSERPDEGFKYGGVIISNGDIGYDGRSERDALNYWGNVHGSIENVGGKWYVFYHRQTNKNEQTRQGCAEEITINPDGSIDQVEMTSCGLNGGPLEGKGEYPAYIACNLMSASGALKCKYGPFSRHKYKYHPCVTEYEKGKQCIRDMRRGAVAGFKYFCLQDLKKVGLIVRGGGGKIKVSTELRGEPFASVYITPSKKWEYFEIEAKVCDGVSALYFEYDGDGVIDFLSFELQ